MSVLQLIILILVALGGTGVVLTHSPTNQAIVLSFYGLLLAILFLIFQAPDVALSEIVVGGVAVPLMILLTLAKAREYAQRHEEAEEPEESGTNGEEKAT